MYMCPCCHVLILEAITSGSSSSRPAVYRVAIKLLETVPAAVAMRLHLARHGHLLFITIFRINITAGSAAGTGAGTGAAGAAGGSVEEPAADAAGAGGVVVVKFAPAGMFGIR